MTSAASSPDHDRWLEEQDAAESDRLWYEETEPAAAPYPNGAAVWVWSPKGGTGTSTVAAAIAVRSGAQLNQIRGEPSEPGDCLLIDCASGDLRHLVGIAPRDPNKRLLDNAGTELALTDYDFTHRHNHHHQGLTELKAHTAAEALYTHASPAGPGLRLLDVAGLTAESPANPDHAAFTGLVAALCAVAPVVVIDAGRDPRDRGLAVIKRLPHAQPAAVLRNCYMSLSQSSLRPRDLFERTYMVVEPRRGVSIDVVENLCGARTVTPVRFDDAVARACDAGSLSMSMPAACHRFDLPSNISARIAALTHMAAVTDPDPDLPDPGF